MTRNWILRMKIVKKICLFLHQSPIAPRYIFWYHNSRMINYDQERGGIKVKIDTKPKVSSRLSIENANPSDSGNYTCAADNTLPDSITVYITQGRMGISYPQIFVTPIILIVERKRYPPN